MEIIHPNSPRGQSTAVSRVLLRVFVSGCASKHRAGSSASLFNELTLILLTVSFPSLPQSHGLLCTLGGIPCDIIIPNLKQTDEKDKGVCVCVQYHDSQDICVTMPWKQAEGCGCGPVSSVFSGASFPPPVSQVLTGAAVLVGHVDVDVRAEGQHGADDIIATLPCSPHEGGPPLEIGFILH